MNRDLAIAMFLSGAYQFVDFVEQGGDNHGQVVEAFLKSVGLEEGQPWCMAMVNYIGWRAFMKVDYATLKRSSSWPLFMSGGCQLVGEKAQAKGILRDTPDIGDVFLKYYPKYKRWAHTGILLGQAPNGKWATLEGNTTDQPGSRNGYGVLLKHQTFGERDRFIDWTAKLEGV